MAFQNICLFIYCFSSESLREILKCGFKSCDVLELRIPVKLELKHSHGKQDTCPGISYKMAQ